MRLLFTTADARARGLSIDALRWGERTGRWRRVERGVYADGPEPLTLLDRARARILASGGTARGCLAGVLHGLDGVVLDGVPRRHRDVVPSTVVAAVPCSSVLQTLVDLALLLDDDRWEQALESALRRRLVSTAELDVVTGRGSARITRVLARRPVGAPPTESLLETLMVQLARTVPGLGEPVRQYEVFDASGSFVARVDLCWPDIGLFLELDGQHHRDQPVYDARRETAVVAATGWLPGRFTWHEVTRVPRATARRLEAIAAQCSRRAAA